MTGALQSAIIRDPLVVSPDTTVLEAITQMNRVRSAGATLEVAEEQPDERSLEARSSCVLVVEDAQVIGIFTERDVVRLISQRQSFAYLVMRQEMTAPVITLPESAFTHISVAVHLLQQHRIRHLPILDEQHRLIGLVTDDSLLHISSAIAKSEQRDGPFCQLADRGETLLRDISQRISQSLDLQTIFDTACEGIRQFIQADRVGIFKFDPESGFDDGAFVAESVVEPFDSAIAIPVHDHTFGDNYASHYFQGRYLAIDDIYDTSLSPCHVEILAKFQVRATLVIPLTLKESLWGLLCIHQCSMVRHWEETEVDLTQHLANQLTIAIQQAHLFEQLQQELAERERTQQTLTERNQQLAISNVELARATRLKDEFLANMSHELRTPLNVILGMTEALQDGIFGELNADQIDSLQTIERSGNHLLELINDILDLAKIESGKLELDLRSTTVASLCQFSLAFVKQQALKKRLRLEEKQTRGLLTLTVDERRIRQVLINLLNNAVKFTPKGGQITLEVSLHQRPADLEATESPPQNVLRFAVSDTGIGIAPEQLKRLFQPFVQVDSALNRQYTGTGLGLALVKRIVELHGGEVGVTSEAGVGSCFTFDLPYTAATAALSESDPRYQDDRDSDPPEQEVTPLILLAEDNEDNVTIISSYLSAKGYRLLRANNGREAIALAQSETPDMILMDIQMPEIDGLEAMRQIRRVPTLVEVPIIALTSLAMKGDREQCLAAGANDYLSKPIKLKQLVGTMQQLLRIREQSP